MTALSPLWGTWNVLLSWWPDKINLNSNSKFNTKEDSAASYPAMWEQRWPKIHDVRRGGDCVARVPLGVDVCGCLVVCPSPGEVLGGAGVDVVDVGRGRVRLGPCPMALQHLAVVDLVKVSLPNQNLATFSKNISFSIMILIKGEASTSIYADWVNGGWF